MQTSASVPPDRDARSRRIAAGLFALVVTFGAWLRLDQITLQVIGDDEWHAIFFLQDHGYGDVFRSFGASDHSIPLTLYAKLVAETVGLNEIAMRAPVLAFGLLALIVLPILFRPVVGTRTALVFAALLAISPLHVYFSRYARPYSAMLLLGIVGVLAFDRWRTSGGRRWAALYAACAVLGVWFQPVVGPFLLAPFAWALLPRRGEKRFAARLRELVPLGLVVALGLAVLVGPPLASDLHSIRDKAARSWFSADSLDQVFVLLSGAPRLPVACACACAVLVGLLSLRRRCSEFLRYASFLTAVQLAALAISRPDLLESPIVLVRYTLPISAFVLLLLAEGLAFLDGAIRQRWKRWPPALASSSAVLALVAFGPLIPIFDPDNGTYFRPNSFTNHGYFQYAYEPRERQRMTPAYFSAQTSFYSRLASTLDVPGSERERIVEAPAFVDWGRSPFVLYQKIHRRRVLIGYQDERGAMGGELGLPRGDPRFRFENLVHLGDFDRLAEIGVRWVVLHKHMRAEAMWGGRPDPRWAEPWIALYSGRFGPPRYEDEELAAFEIEPKRAP